VPWRSPTKQKSLSSGLAVVHESEIGLSRRRAFRVSATIASLSGNSSGHRAAGRTAQSRMIQRGHYLSRKAKTPAFWSRPTADFSCALCTAILELSVFAASTSPFLLPVGFDCFRIEKQSQ
jgi:hypothetical protein